MLRQTTSQKLTQKVLPKIILEQNLLSLQTLALENIIKRELELNPMLEEGSEFESEEANTDPELQEQEIETKTVSEDDVNFESEQAKTSEDEYNWDEYFENEETEVRQFDRSSADRYETVIVNEDDRSLKNSLLLQLHLSGLNKKDIFTGEEIIWSLNDEGYFIDDEEDILKDLNSKKAGTEFENIVFTIDDINDSLNYIQKKLDPAGIAARNLKECLLIQTERSEANEELKKLSADVLENHIDELRLKKYEKVSKELNIDLHKVKEVFDFIHRLNPKPGQAEETHPNDYIIPDLILKKIDGKYEVILNEKFTPSLRINKTYRDLYSKEKNTLDKDTKEYIVNNFNKAKWFIDAINSRRETIVKIMEAIVSRQKDFFDNNDTGLKPMYEKDVAEHIGMDSSTVSRAVRGKYVQTDSGIYELRSFFTTPLAMNDGEDVSNTEAKIKLRELIDNENKRKPLSDEELSSEMKKLGFKIARRTVAKYRESINLPIAKLRREI